MSLIALLQIGCLLAFALLLLLAAWQDLRTMRIADSLSLAIVAVFAAWALSGVALGTLSWSGVGLAGVCAVGLFGARAAALSGGAVGGGRGGRPGPPSPCPRAARLA